VVDEALELLQREEDGIGEALDAAHTRKQCRGRVRSGGGGGGSRARPALPPQVIQGRLDAVRPGKRVGDEPAGARRLAPREVHEAVAAGEFVAEVPEPPPGGALGARPHRTAGVHGLRHVLRHLVQWAPEAVPGCGDDVAEVARQLQLPLLGVVRGHRLRR